MARKYVPKTKKHRRRPRYYRRKKRNMLSFTKAPVPNSFATKLRYVEDTSINPGVAGIAGVHIVSANGCYDPNITGSGHQPRGFDQMMQLWDHYTVIGAKITVEFIRPYNTNSYALALGVALKDSPTPAVDKNDYLEGRNVVSKATKSSTSTNDSFTYKLSKTFSTRKFLGFSKPLSVTAARGDISNNPGEQAYFHIFAAPFQSVDNEAIIVNYRVDYLVVFTEPKQPTQS